MEYNDKKTLQSTNTQIKSGDSKNIQHHQTEKEHVVLLLDESASMSESFHIPPMFAGEKDQWLIKRNMLKKAVDKMLSVSDGSITEYTIIGFHSSMDEKITRSSDILAIREKFHLENGGSTKMAEGIRFSLTKDPDRIVLFTDGQPNPPKEEVINAAREAKAQAVVIDTIGIGDADTLLLEQIAEITGGVYAYAKSDHDLEEIFQALETQNYLQLEDHSKPINL